jgi:hypothetical protein
MNYLKVYCNLIRKAENGTPPEGYTEKHHTFPKSIYGNNKRIVILSGREHYIAHALLEKVCIQRYGLNHWKTKKMIYAFWAMNNQFKKCQKRYKNSVLYELKKLKYSNQIQGKNNPFYGKKHSTEFKNKRSKTFSLLSPSGNIICDINVEEFCRKNNLISTRILDVIKGKQKSHRGWRNIKDYGKNDSEFCRGKYFSLICPDGNVVTGKNLNQFCRENNLNNSCLRDVIKGRQKSHKGYRAIPNI